MVLDEVDLQIRPQELRHGLLHELVGNGFFRLVFVAGLGRKVVGHKNQAVLDVLPCDLALVLLIFVLIPQILVHCGDKGALRGLFRRAAVFQPGGVVVMLNDLHLVGKAAGGRELHLVFRLVRPVPAPLFRLPEHRRRQGALSGQLSHIVLNPVLIDEFLLFKFSVFLLIAEFEGDSLVDHRLTAQHIRKVFRRDGNVGEHVQIRQPVGAGAGLFAPVRRLHLHLAYDLTPLKVQGIFVTVPPNGDIHIAGGVLGGAGAQAVESQRIFVVVAGEVVVFAAGVQFAVHQLPVVALLLLVPVHRAAPAHILHLDGAVIEPGDGDDPSVSLPRLVNGVGEDLKDGVFAAVQPV